MKGTLLSDDGLLFVYVSTDTTRSLCSLVILRMLKRKPIPITKINFNIKFYAEVIKMQKYCNEL